MLKVNIDDIRKNNPKARKLLWEAEFDLLFGNKDMKTINEDDYPEFKDFKDIE